MVDHRSDFRIDTDVLVVGGGAAGLAAAVTAARNGHKVTVLERYGFCGGGAVAGLSGTICGLFLASEDANAAPKRLVHGFVDEFISYMQQRNGLSEPVKYGNTYTLVHDPIVWRDTGDALLRDAGAQVLYHSVVTDVLMEGNERVAGVMAYTKQGKLQVNAKITIDASGDADIAAMAGLPTYRSKNGVIQNPTMIFRIQGVDVDRFLNHYGDNSVLLGEVVERIKHANDSGKYRLDRSKIFLFPTTQPGQLLCNATRIIGRDGRDLDPLNAKDLTEAEVQGRSQVREYERFFREYLVGCENAYVVDTGVQVGIRQSRQIQGVQTLMNTDVTAGNKHKSGIARSAWPIEQHSGTVPKLEWLFGDYYEIPYECFVPEVGESLLMAGRCLSAEAEAMASSRVTAQCFSYGHAIGHAASISLRDGVAPRHIDPLQVRHAVNQDGAQLD